jgi:uncharacterized protein (TIGR00255 family)
MIRSMTAYARRERRGAWGQLVWELRAVNHRYLELSPRLPEALRGLEPEVRALLGAGLGRGKVEATLKFNAGLGAGAELDLNVELARSLTRVCGELAELMPEARQASVMDLASWPGVLGAPEVQVEELRPAVLDGLGEAVAELVATREREGGELAGFLLKRCAAVEELVAEVRRRRPQVVERLQERWRSRLADLGLEAEPGRLEQELALGAQKLDVDEELDRLTVHIGELRAILERSEPVGRRLDFLMQEFNREVNTLGSKSGDPDTTRHVVDLKVLVEQMREQVQNVE